MGNVIHIIDWQIVKLKKQICEAMGITMEQCEKGIVDDEPAIAYCPVTLDKEKLSL
jgi:hypothetical protein